MTFKELPDPQTILPQPRPDWPESWRVSHHYDLLELGNHGADRGYVHAYNARARATLEAVGRFAPPPARVLDIAAGQGNFSLRLAAMGYDVTWNDLRAELVEYVRLKSSLAERLSFAPGNAFDLGPEHQARYDVVLATEIIEHTAHPDEFLRRIANFVRPDGILVLSSPNGAYIRSKLPRFSECSDPSQFEAVQFKPDADGHIFLIWRDELESFARSAGLQLVDFEFLGNPLTVGHMKLSAMLSLLPTSAVTALERFTQRLPAVIAERVNSHWVSVLRRLQ